MLVQVRSTEVVSLVCAQIELDLFIRLVGNINPNIETLAGFGVQKQKKSDLVGFSLGWWIEYNEYSLYGQPKLDLFIMWD